MRYKVIEGSNSGHCCFDYSVIDTDKNTPFEDGRICETFYKPEADLICNALNKTER